MIGLTGATGRLGQAILRQSPNIVPFGRAVPQTRVSVLIHAAAPRAHDEIGLALFGAYNLAIRQYCNRYKPKLVSVGSCWQILDGTCRDTTYAALKRRQADLFADAVHVIPYWIYGEGRGFISEVASALRRGETITSAGEQARDFMHVDDVARDVLHAMDLEAGRIVSSCTTIPVRPVDLLLHFGWNATILEPEPTATLAYPYESISAPRHNVYDYLDEQARHAKAAQR